MELLTGTYFECVLGMAFADFSLKWDLFIVYLGHFLLSCKNFLLLMWNNLLLINLLKRLLILDYWLKHLM